MKITTNKIIRELEKKGYSKGTYPTELKTNAYAAIFVRCCYKL